MNPNRDRAVAVRRQALVDQIEGLEVLIAAGLDEPHIAVRLVDTRTELTALGHTWVTRGPQNTV